MFATARGGVRIGYDILGSGRPIVMLHDFGESSRFWCDCGYVKSCLTEGRQAVLVDLRGHGDSSEPSDASGCDPINCSWDVIAVLDHGVAAWRSRRDRKVLWNRHGNNGEGVAHGNQAGEMASR